MFGSALRVLILAAMLSATATAGGRVTRAQAPQLTIVLSGVDDSAYPAVSLVMSVELDGRPVGDLTGSTFEVLEDGQLATLISVERAMNSDIPLALGIVIDTSGSMAGAGITRAKAAAISLIEGLGPRDSAAIIAFADGVRVVRALSQDKAALRAGVESLTASGNTALYDALAKVSELIAVPGPARRAVIVLSDGAESGGRSTNSAESALASVAAGRTVFYLVGLGADIDRPFLERLAAVSGGRLFVAPSSGDIAGIYSGLADLLRSQYIVRFQAVPGSGVMEETVVVNVTHQGHSGAGRSVAQIHRPAQPTAAVAPAIAATTVAAIPPSSPAQATADQPASAGDARAVWPLILIGLIVVLGGAGGMVFLRRRSSGPVSPTISSRTYESADTLAAPTRVGTLASVAGPLQGETFAVASAPITLGSADSCSVRLPQSPAVAAEHVRLWWRDGLLMLHHVAPGYETLVNGSPVEWFSLADGHEFSVGDNSFRFTALPGDERPGPAPA